MAALAACLGAGGEETDQGREVGREGDADREGVRPVELQNPVAEEEDGEDQGVAGADGQYRLSPSDPRSSPEGVEGLVISSG